MGQQAAPCTSSADQNKLISLAFELSAMGQQRHQFGAKWQKRLKSLKGDLRSWPDFPKKSAPKLGSIAPHGMLLFFILNFSFFISLPPYRLARNTLLKRVC